MSYFVKKNVYANWNEFCSRIKKIRFTLWISINIHEWNFTLNLLFSIKAVRARKANSLARPNSRRSIPSEGKEISKLVGARRHRLLSSPPTMTIAGRERGSRHIRRPISKKAKCKVEQKGGERLRIHNWPPPYKFKASLLRFFLVERWRNKRNYQHR